MGDDMSLDERTIARLERRVAALEAENERLKRECERLTGAYRQHMVTAKCERDQLRAFAGELAKALEGVKHRNSEPQRLCWCDTVAGLYCCAQPQCLDANTALAAYRAATEGK